MTSNLAARPLAAVALALALLSTPACAKAEAPHGHETATAPAAQAAPGAADAGKADASKADLSKANRKIIHNAQLHIEASSASEARRKAVALVEREGGYVADSNESRSSHDGERITVRMTFKVPAERLSATLDGLRALGTRVTHDHLGSQDVTAEFFDLEARLKTQRAVEAQMLEITREAKSVSDLLAVQRQLGEIRSEIERMEGRRNQINQQASLSTVELSIQGDEASPAIGATIRRASNDAINVGSLLIHGGVRALGVLTPLALFFGPLGYMGWRIARALLRRLSRA